jgi:hypothetical protein
MLSLAAAALLLNGQHLAQLCIIWCVQMARKAHGTLKQTLLH